MILKGVSVKNDVIDLEVMVNERGNIELHPVDSNYDFNDIVISMLDNEVILGSYYE